MRPAAFAFVVTIALVAGGGAAAHASSGVHPGRAFSNPVSAHSEPVEGRAPATATPSTAGGPATDPDGVSPSSAHPSDATPITIGEPVDLPPGVVLFIESGCWACDGPAGPLYRAFRTFTGNLHVERVFSADMVTASAQATVIRYQVSVDEGSLIALVCTENYCGGLGAADSDAEVTVYRSRDLGASWSKDRSLKTNSYPLGVTPDGVFVRQDIEGSRSSSARNLDTGVVTLPPAIPGVAFPYPLSQGLFWLSESFDYIGGILRQTSALYQNNGHLFASGLPDIALNEVIFDNTAPVAIFGAAPMLRPGEPLFYVADIRRATPRLLSTGFFMMGGAVLDGSHLITSMDLERLPPGPHYPEPGILDLDIGAFNPIAGLDSAGLGRSLVRAVFTGPFARVTGAPAGCAMLNAAPRPIVTHVGCAPEDAIVRLLGDQRWYHGQWWLSAALADGTAGWMQSTYLER